jgi:hypothetical protein
MTLYDKLGWHEAAAVEGGFSSEHGFTHIGFFLGWLIGRDLHAHRRFSAELVALVQRGQFAASDLIEPVDGKLVSDWMSDEGRAFADARYGAYVDEFSETFRDYPPYGAPDTPTTLALARDLLDRMYAEWVTQGRPAAPAEEARSAGDVGPVELTIVTPPGYTDEEWAEVLRRAGVGKGFERLPIDEHSLSHDPQSPDIPAH